MKPNNQWFALTVTLMASALFAETQFNHAQLTEDTCPLYPMTVSTDLLVGATEGDVFNAVSNGTGSGNYRWLSWNGLNDANSLADRLTPPGNSETYVNPYDFSDTYLNIDDWVEGAPGVKNSRAIRDRMSALVNTDIVVAVWSEKEGTGSNFNYKVGAFAVIELTDYKLNGKGYISFIYKAPAECEGEVINSAPVVLDQFEATNEDTPLSFSLQISDADDDVLTAELITVPGHGEVVVLDGVATYEPFYGFTGEDSFTYRVFDGELHSAIALVSLTVLPVDKPPSINIQTSVRLNDTHK